MARKPKSPNGTPNMANGTPNSIVYATIVGTFGTILGVVISSLVYGAQIKSLKTDEARAYREQKQEDRFQEDYSKNATKESLKNFIFAFLREDESNSVSKYLNYFDDSVDKYLEHGQKTKDEILIDRAKFVTDFPERTYSSEDPQIKEFGPKYYSANVSFYTNVKRANGEVHLDGLQKMEFRMIRKNNRFYIKYYKTTERPKIYNIKTDLKR